MVPTTFLTRKDDVGREPYDSIAWAFEVHVRKPDTHEFQSAVLYGREDSPERIDFYRDALPHADSPVDYEWTAEPR